MSAGPHKDARGAYFWMDVLRFAAAMAVVIEHVRDLLFLTLAEAGPQTAPWKAFYFLTGFGHEAVMVFFVLSGFWISATVDRRLCAASFWPGYLIDRLSRLMIVVIPALVLGGLFDLASLWLGTAYAGGSSGALTVSEPVGPRLALVTLAGNLLFLQSILVPSFGSNGPLWSLANEFWYYLWFPALVLSVRARRPVWALAALGVAALSPALIVGFLVWLFGAALYHLDRRWIAQGRAPRSAAMRALVALGAAAVLALAMTASRLGLIPAGAEIAVGGAFAVFLWTLLRLDPAPSALLRPAASFGAGASFSLYAVHLPLMVLLAGIIPPAQRTAPDVMRLGLFTVLVVGAMAFASIFSRQTEARTPALRRALAERLASARNLPR